MAPASFYELESGRRVIFAQQVNQKKQQAQQIFIRTKSEDKQQIITAREVFQQTDKSSNNDILVFRNGTIYELSSSGQGDTTVGFKQYTLALNPPEATTITKIKATTTGGLIHSDKSLAIAELQWRFSTPFTAIILALLGIPLSQTSPRRGKYAKVVIAVIIYSIFYTLSLVTKTWVGEGVIGPWPGIWAIEGLMVLLLLFTSITFFQKCHITKNS